MKDNEFSRRTFIRSAFLTAAGIITVVLAANGCTSRAITDLERQKPKKLKAVLWIGGHSHEFETIAKIMISAIIIVVFNIEDDGCSNVSSIPTNSFILSL